jgi:predicted metal-dependent HD superfamily phosphohydrolase
LEQNQALEKEFTTEDTKRGSFLKGRIAFMKKVLDQDYIFYSDVFRDSHEDKAHENIDRLVNLMQTELETLS